MANIKSTRYDAPAGVGMQLLPRFARKPGMMGSPMKANAQDNVVAVKMPKKGEIGTLGRMKDSYKVTKPAEAKLPKEGKIAGYKHVAKRISKDETQY